MMASKKKYDIVILTYAPKKDLVNSLVMLLSQTILPEQIIIYNTDKDKFDLTLKSDTGMTLYECINGKFNNKFKVVHIDECDFDHGKARNDASKFCISDYILYMTDDAIPYHEEMCQNMIESFKKYENKVSKVSTVYARQMPKSTATLKEKYVREFNYPDFDVIKEKSREKELGIKNYFCSNVCAMYDRKIFNELGRFEENIILNEDTFYVYTAINKGYRVVYCSSAKVFHSHNLTCREQFSRNFDIGVSQSEKKEIFDRIPLAKEGKQMAFYVSTRLLKGFHIIEFLNFAIECLYRYFGFKKGKKYDRLTLDECIKFSSNKNYFKKMRNNNDIRVN